MLPSYHSFSLKKKVTILLKYKDIYPKICFTNLENILTSLEVQYKCLYVNLKQLITFSTYADMSGAATN